MTKTLKTTRRGHEMKTTMADLHFRIDSTTLFKAIVTGLAKSNELSGISSEEDANQVALFILKELVGVILPSEEMKLGAIV